MNEREIARELILLFRSLQIRPFHSNIDANAIRELDFYLAGIDKGCRLCGFDALQPFVEDVVYKEQGLVRSPLPEKSAVKQFREQGLGEEAICNKLLDIQIDVLRKAYDITDV